MRGRQPGERSPVPPAPPLGKQERPMAEADRARAPAGRKPDLEEDEPFHPLAIFLGVLMVLFLVFGAWFIFKQARCDPLYSDSGLFRSQSCR
jgi:hypothetical protein